LDTQFNLSRYPSLPAQYGDYIHYHPVCHCHGAVPDHPMAGALVQKENLNTEKETVPHTYAREPFRKYSLSVFTEAPAAPSPPISISALFFALFTSFSAAI